MRLRLAEEHVVGNLGERGIAEVIVVDVGVLDVGRTRSKRTLVHPVLIPFHRPCSGVPVPDVDLQVARHPGFVHRIDLHLIVAFPSQALIVVIRKMLCLRRIDEGHAVTAGCSVVIGAILTPERSAQASECTLVDVRTDSVAEIGMGMGRKDLHLITRQQIVQFRHFTQPLVHALTGGDVQANHQFLAFGD